MVPKTFVSLSAARYQNSRMTKQVSTLNAQARLAEFHVLVLEITYS